MSSGGEKALLFQVSERAKTEDSQTFKFKWEVHSEVMAVLDMWQPCCSIYNPQLGAIWCLRVLQGNVNGKRRRENNEYVYIVKAELRKTEATCNAR